MLDELYPRPKKIIIYTDNHKLHNKKINNKITLHNPKIDHKA